MSIHAINWCRKIGKTLKIPSAHRQALMSICCHHNDKTGACFPSHTTIAAEIGMCRRKVVDLVKDLEANGLISTKKRRVEGRQGSNQYALYGQPIATEWVPRVHDTTPSQSAYICTLSRVHEHAHDRDLSSMGQKAPAKMAKASGGRA